MSNVQRAPASGSAPVTFHRSVPTHSAQVLSHRHGSMPQKRTMAVKQEFASHRRNRLVTTGSYYADTYGPMGGDARIKVIGVGGGGGNAVNRMISSGLQVCISVKMVLLKRDGRMGLAGRMLRFGFLCLFVSRHLTGILLICRE